jgi:hypothetical protein
MATLIQEIAGSASAWHGGDDDTFSMTFDLDFPPMAPSSRWRSLNSSNGALEQVQQTTALRAQG